MLTPERLIFACMSSFRLFILFRDGQTILYDERDLAVESGLEDDEDATSSHVRSVHKRLGPRPARSDLLEDGGDSADARLPSIFTLEADDLGCSLETGINGFVLVSRRFFYLFSNSAKSDTRTSRILRTSLLLTWTSLRWCRSGKPLQSYFDDSKRLRSTDVSAGVAVAWFS